MEQLRSYQQLLVLYILIIVNLATLSHRGVTGSIWSSIASL